MLVVLGIGMGALLLAALAVIREKSSDFRTLFGIVMEDSEFRKVFTKPDQAVQSVNALREGVVELENVCEVGVAEPAVNSAAIGK